MKFEPIKEKIKLATTLIQPITIDLMLVQILNFMGNLHAVLSVETVAGKLMINNRIFKFF